MNWLSLLFLDSQFSLNAAAVVVMLIGGTKLLPKRPDTPVKRQLYG